MEAAAAADDIAMVLQTRYNTMGAAMAALDGATIRSLLAPDFTSVDVSGNAETGAQMVADIDRLEPDPDRTSATVLLSITVAGDVATVRQRYDMRTVRYAADGVAHDVELVTLSDDRWVRPAGFWLLQRTETEDVSVFRDGRLLAHRIKP